MILRVRSTGLTWSGKVLRGSKTDPAVNLCYQTSCVVGSEETFRGSDGTFGTHNVQRFLG
jgi:hypothetical protein